MPDSFEFDYAPGTTKPTHEYGTPVGTAAYQDQFLTEAVQELLASTVAYRQRGVTLAGGQGVLPTGAVIAQSTASGLYYFHDSAARNGAGTNVAIGILRDSRDTGSGAFGPTSNPNPVSPSGKVATSCMGNLVWAGALNAALISGTDTTSFVTGFGGGIGSGATGAYTSLLTKGRLQTGNATAANPQFAGSPFDSSEGNIFIFLWVSLFEVETAGRLDACRERYASSVMIDWRSRPPSTARRASVPAGASSTAGMRMLAAGSVTGAGIDMMAAVSPRSACRAGVPLTRRRPALSAE